MAKPSRPTTSFSTKRINATTFVIREDDSFAEHPLIYAKVHPKAPVIVLSDTGSDEPSEEHKHGRLSLSRCCKTLPVVHCLSVNFKERRRPCYGD